MASYTEKLIKALEKKTGSNIHLEIASFSSYFYATARLENSQLNSPTNSKETYSEIKKDQTFISDQVYSGFDANETTAITKALMELVERQTYYELVNKNDLNDLYGSDGMAAFPRGLYFKDGIDLSADLARNYAFEEALERFVWASWWDRKDIKYTLETFDLDQSQLFPHPLMRDLVAKLLIESFLIIKPVHSIANYEVIIIYAKLKDQGFLSAGACGLEQHSDRIYIRSLNELLKHGLSYQRMMTYKKRAESKLSSYEQKLWLNAQDPSYLLSRLGHKGQRVITVPALEVDQQLVSSFSDLANIYHCLFADQPIFLDNDPKRFCL